MTKSVVLKFILVFFMIAAEIAFLGAWAAIRERIISERRSDG